MVVYDDKGTPQFDYDSEERKRLLFIFLSGALCMKNHIIYDTEDTTNHIMKKCFGARKDG